MLTEQQLTNSEVNASDDMDGMDSMIRSLWNEIAKRRIRAVTLNRQHKTKEADDMKAETDNIQAELSGLIKAFNDYDKYLSLRNKKTGGKSPVGPMTPGSTLREERSSNGSIVAEIPKNK